MHSKVRPIFMILLLAILLVPGLIQAQTPARHDIQKSRANASLTAPGMGSFSAVWNLLSTLFKTGVGLDPSGTPAPPSGNTSTAASGGDTGTQLDPSGGPQ